MNTNLNLINEYCFVFFSSLTGAFISGILQGQTADVCVGTGQLAASLSLRSHQAVPPSVTRDALTPDIRHTYAGRRIQV